MTATPPPRNPNNFELLRLVAATQVLLVHGIEHLRIPAPDALKSALGWFPGVTIFFVISGYLITGSLLRSPNLGAYARNRFLRIFPALWMCSLVTLALLYLAGMLSGAPPLRVLLWLLGQSSVAPHTPAFLAGWGTGSVNGSLWTIPVELQFYLLLPALVLAIGRSPRRQAGALLALTAVGCAYLWLRSHYAGTLPARVLLMCVASWLYLFLLGVVLQLHRGFVDRWLAGRAHWWLAGYLGWTALLAAAGVPVEGNAATPLTTLPLGLLTIACAYTRPALAWRLLGGTDLSYGLYIYHMLIVNLFVQYGWTGRWPLLPALLAAAAAVAALSWHGLEAPMLRLKRNR